MRYDNTILKNTKTKDTFYPLKEIKDIIGKLAMKNVKEACDKSLPNLSKDYKPETRFDIIA